MGEFAVFIEHLEAKNVSASWGLRPLDLWVKGAKPLDPESKCNELGDSQVYLWSVAVRCGN